MVALDRLFQLEVDFHHRLRTLAPDLPDARELHASYAIQAGYEQLLGVAGRATAADVEALASRLALAGDARDVLSARDSVMGLLGLTPFEARPAARGA